MIRALLPWESHNMLYHPLYMQLTMAALAILLSVVTWIRRK